MTVTNTTGEPISKRRTPLPKLQIFLVLLIQFAEPVTATVIYPFVNQFVRETGITKGDEKKTGYYAGIIESVFFITEALTVFYWGWASDRLGRRPVLLLGPVGLAGAMLGFGSSKTFWPLVAYRSLQGVFNGNIGVAKSVIAELTDSTNMADAFALMPLMWSFGTTLAPLLGGVLAQPHLRWPDTLGMIHFLREHPYFLPCAAASLIALTSGFLASLGLKETLPSAIAKKKRHQPQSAAGLLADTDAADYGSNGHTERTDSTPGDSLSRSENEAQPVDINPSANTPPPLRALLTSNILITLLNCSFLNFSDMSSQVLLPLVYSTSIELGGLGLTPYTIGVIMGTWGFVNAVVQVNFLGRVIRRLGPRKAFIVSYASLTVVVGCYPLLSFFARRAERVDAYVWAIMVIQLTFLMAIYMAYGAIGIIVVESAPDRAALGATTGLAQTTACVSRAMGPTFASSLFSISLERHIAGGNLVYLVLLGITIVGIRVSFLLPTTPRTHSGTHH